MGGGGVQNKDYDALQVIQKLEKDGTITDVQKNPQKYDSAVNFGAGFSSSKDFRTYIQQFDRGVDIEEACFIGWLFAFIAELALFTAYLLRKLCKMIHEI